MYQFFVVWVTLLYCLVLLSSNWVYWVKSILSGSLTKFVIHSGISGNLTANCIPLATWLDAATETLSIEFQADATNSGAGVDVSAFCHPRQSVSRFTWSNRRNAFSPEDECFKCGPCHANALCVIGNGEFTCQCDRGKIVIYTMNYQLNTSLIVFDFYDLLQYSLCANLNKSKMNKLDQSALKS